MSTVWYSSDLHFRHHLVAKLRGFTREEPLPGKKDAGKTVTAGNREAHDAQVLAVWNETVSRDDIAFIAGDFALHWDAPLRDILASMHGRKILVTGNHDIMSERHRDAWKHLPEWVGPYRFESVHSVLTRKTGGREFLISHYPYQGDREQGMERYLQYRLRDYGMWLVHGHTHLANRLGADIEYHLPFIPFGGLPTGKLDRALIPRRREVHVGWDAWGRPVAETEVIALMTEEEERSGVPAVRSRQEE